MAGHKDEAQDRYRLDKWLWAVRFYKTHCLAQKPFAAGHVDVNGDGAKPSRAIRVGDVVTLRLNQVEWVLHVKALSDQRSAAPIARTLYAEDEAGCQRREARQLLLQAGRNSFPHCGSRPNRQARGQMKRFKDSL